MAVKLYNASMCVQDVKEYRLINQLEGVREAILDRELRDRNEMANYKQKFEPMVAATGMSIDIEATVDSAIKSSSGSVSADVVE